MKIVYNHFAAHEVIPVHDYIRNRKLIKYFNHETSAALVSAAQLLKAVDFSPAMPFYYETGVMENESLGLDQIAEASKGASGKFSQQNFAEKGTKAVPPLTQFKALYNMPLSFVAIEHGLTGDSSVVYASAAGLLTQALLAPTAGCVLLGCGNIFADASVASGFALLTKDEIKQHSSANTALEAYELFRQWHRSQP